MFPLMLLTYPVLLQPLDRPSLNAFTQKGLLLKSQNGPGSGMGLEMGGEHIIKGQWGEKYKQLAYYTTRR